MEFRRFDGNIFIYQGLGLASEPLDWELGTRDLENYTGHIHFCYSVYTTSPYIYTLFCCHCYFNIYI